MPKDAAQLQARQRIYDRERERFRAEREAARPKGDDALLQRLDRLDDIYADWADALRDGEPIHGHPLTQEYVDYVRDEIVKLEATLSPALRARRAIARHDRRIEQWAITEKIFAAEVRREMPCERPSWWRRLLGR